VRVDSSSVGDPGRFRTLAELERKLESLTPPQEVGRVVLLVARLDGGGRRETPARVRVGPDVGVPGDAWGRRPAPKPEGQLAVMQRDVAELIANGQPLTLFGDNLFLELDLSAANLPVGSRVRAGGATLEITPKPHDGCLKFRARFGPDALRFVGKPELRHRNLRGIYMRVVEGGELGVGDPVEILARGAATPARG
jgi:MOSC domain-containing protein YiiM